MAATQNKPIKRNIKAIICIWMHPITSNRHKKTLETQLLDHNKHTKNYCFYVQYRLSAHSFT